MFKCVNVNNWEIIGIDYASFIKNVTSVIAKYK